MAAKRFLSLFKSSNKREKENNDPLLSEYQYHLSNGQRRSRRVNFQSADGSKRRSCATEVINDDDDGSEVTLTATEASRQQHPNNRKMPLNPYLVVTEPKLKHGPRSCPGGGGGGGQHLFDFNYLDNDDISGTNGGTLDRSLEARSEFISTQPHRRSSRRRILPLDEKTSTSQSVSHPPFSEIGNGRSQIGQQRENGVNNIGVSSRYKNIPPWDFNNWGFEGGLGRQQMYIKLKEQQKEIAELVMAYREEKSRRKAFQRDLKREQEDKERYKMETFRLQSFIGVLLRQQQQPNNNINNTNNSNQLNGIDLNTLINAVGIPQPNNLYASWTGNTPSSSSVAAGSSIHPQQHQQTSTIPNSWTPCRAAATFDYLGFQPPPAIALFGNGGGGPGECLAAPILSSSSLHSQQSKQQKINNKQQSEDEVINFRKGQLNTNSFSGSSRLTTGDLSELERDKHDLASEISSNKEFSLNGSREIERGNNNQNNNITLALHGLSFSADDCQNLFIINKQKDLSVPNLFPDIELPLRDDGYATSETNMSASGIANSECTITSSINGEEGGNIFVNNENNFNSKYRRRSKSTGDLNKKIEKKFVFII